jgi:hypothetical protein
MIAAIRATLVTIAVTHVMLVAIQETTAEIPAMTAVNRPVTPASLHVTTDVILAMIAASLRVTTAVIPATTVVSHLVTPATTVVNLHEATVEMPVMSVVSLPVTLDATLAMTVVSLPVTLAMIAESHRVTSAAMLPVISVAATAHRPRRTMSHLPEAAMAVVLAVSVVAATGVAAAVGVSAVVAVAARATRTRKHRRSARLRRPPLPAFMSPPTTSHFTSPTASCISIVPRSSLARTRKILAVIGGSLTCSTNCLPASSAESLSFASRRRCASAWASLFSPL